MPNRLDSLTGNCRISLPTLFERIMAADGYALPTRSHAAHRGCVRLPELAPPDDNRVEPPVNAGLAVKTPPAIATHHPGRQAMSARAGPFA